MSVSIVQAVPIPNPGAVCRREADGWAVLFNPDTAGAVALNPTGIAIWQLIDGRRDAVAIAAALRRQFSEVPPEVDADVAALIQTLADEGLVGYQIWPPP
jgi:hypothetical protein